MCYRAWRLAEAGAASEWGLRKGSRDETEGWATGELLELQGRVDWASGSKRSLVEEDLGEGVGLGLWGQ